MSQQPASAPARHGAVDVLRGLALLGILAVNLEFLAQPSLTGWPDVAAWWDVAARWLTLTLFELKSYLVFALLFGYGVAVMMRRAPAGPTFRRRHLRRMALLALLGLAHAVFLFVGDILLTYALVGTALLAVVRWPRRRLLVLAGILWAASFLIVLAVAAATVGTVPEVPGEAARAAAYADGGFLEVAAQRLRDLPIALTVIALLNWGSVAAAFCLGLALGRTDVLADPARHRVRARRVMRWCLPVGFGLSAVAATLVVAGGDRGGGAPAAVSLVLENLAGPVAVAGVVAAAVVLSAGRWWPRLEAAVTPGGRSSLSVYLSESLVASLVFAGYGLGLGGRVGPALALAAAVAIWLALELAARWWLTGHRQGPAEWLLRWVTYLRRPPLRRPPEPRAP